MVTMFPAIFPVQTQAFTDAAEDAHGNPVESWSTPVPQHVITYYSEQSDEPRDSGRNAVITEVVVLADRSFSVGPRDRVTIPDEPLAGVYEVEGLPNDYTHNPFGDLGGYEYHLRRVEG